MYKNAKDEYIHFKKTSCKKWKDTEYRKQKLQFCHKAASFCFSRNQIHDSIKPYKSQIINFGKIWVKFCSFFDIFWNYSKWLVVYHEKRIKVIAKIVRTMRKISCIISALCDTIITKFIQSQFGNDCKNIQITGRKASWKKGRKLVSSARAT